MDYRYLFHIAWLLITAPLRAWREISEGCRQPSAVAFVFPLITLVALGVFLNSLIRVGWSSAQDYEVAMKACCQVAVALMGGFFFTCNLIVRFHRVLSVPALTAGLMQELAGYSMLPVLLMTLVRGLLPMLALPTVLVSLLSGLLAWKGIGILFPLWDESHRLRMALLLALLLTGISVTIEYLFGFLVQVLD